MRKRANAIGYLELIIGITLIAMGLFTIIRPQIALFGMLILFGFAAVLLGIIDIIIFIRFERYTGFAPVLSLIAGILSVMSGIMLILYPDAGRLALLIVFPIWFISHCISQLLRLREIRILAGNGTYYFTMIMSIIGLVLGFLMIIMPHFTLFSVGTLVALYMILLGINSIVIAFSKMGRR